MDHSQCNPIENLFSKLKSHTKIIVHNTYDELKENKNKNKNTELERIS